MHLLHDLLLSTARWGFTFTAAHVAGVENKIADAISRFRWQEFRQLAREAHSSPCLIPQLPLDSLTPLSRAMVFAFLSPGFGSFHLESICIRYQCKFVEFCHQAGKLHPNGLPCTADRWTLFVCSISCRFNSAFVN